MTFRPFLAAAALAALPATALAQDVQPPTGPSFDAALTAPASVTKAQLKKGVTVKVTCAEACDARLQLTGRIGIITTKSGRAEAGAAKAFKLKAQPFQIKELKKGTKLTLALDARSDQDGGGQDVKKIKVR